MFAFLLSHSFSNNIFPIRFPIVSKFLDFIMSTEFGGHFDIIQSSEIHTKISIKDIYVKFSIMDTEKKIEFIEKLITITSCKS